MLFGLMLAKHVRRYIHAQIECKTIKLVTSLIISLQLLYHHGAGADTGFSERGSEHRGVSLKQGVWFFVITTPKSCLL